MYCEIQNAPESIVLAAHKSAQPAESCGLVDTAPPSHAGRAPKRSGSALSVSAVDVSSELCMRAHGTGKRVACTKKTPDCVGGTVNGNNKFLYPVSAELVACDAKAIAQGSMISVADAFSGTLAEGKAMYACVVEKDNTIYSGLATSSFDDAVQLNCQDNGSVLRKITLGDAAKRASGGVNQGGCTSHDAAGHLNQAQAFSPSFIAKLHGAVQGIANAMKEEQTCKQNCTSQHAQSVSTCTNEAETRLVDCQHAC